ncbi:unnamed protein product [Schistosoma margrebowiei]|uniref:Uncharacterized protein n=1 Tax=Schistosoma margrebowiei TaxID=48269 RepID=A0A3P7VPG4_9TREM|nr:unnamed protein product [Schistosoma margrebowiei]
MVYQYRISVIYDISQLVHHLDYMLHNSYITCHQVHVQG